MIARNEQFRRIIRKIFARSEPAAKREFGAMLRRSTATNCQKRPRCGRCRPALHGTFARTCNFTHYRSDPSALQCHQERALRRIASPYGDRGSRRSIATRQNNPIRVYGRTLKIFSICSQSGLANHSSYLVYHRAHRWQGQFSALKTDQDH